MSFFRRPGFVTNKEAQDAETANIAFWVQTVISQHSVHATVAGLSVTALTLFASFNSDLSDWQKILFILALIALSVQVGCLVFMSEHERRDAYPGSNVTDDEREKENVARLMLNLAAVGAFITIVGLLIITVLGSAHEPNPFR